MQLEIELDHLEGICQDVIAIVRRSWRYWTVCNRTQAAEGALVSLLGALANVLCEIDEELLELECATAEPAPLNEHLTEIYQRLGGQDISRFASDEALMGAITMQLDELLLPRD